MKTILGLSTAILWLWASNAGAVAPFSAPFSAHDAPPAPDYAKASAWAARGDRPGASQARPDGATPIAAAADADVFYINPTTYRSQQAWNQSIQDRAANAWTDASVIARQASVFNACCRVFAPRYRQGSVYALQHYAGEGRQALDLAYGDVERAFDYYIAHYNHGRPFILASHSQGSLHMESLLQRRIDGSALRKQLVAVYILGINISEGDFGRTFKTIPVCEKPDQTGCAVGWNSFLPTVDLEKVAKGSEQRYVDLYPGAPGATTLCINPLTFDTAQPTAAASRSKGAVPGTPGEGAMRPLVAGKVAARCERGMLIVDASPTLELEPLAGGRMHYHDYGLFYEDLRENAQLRVASFLEKQADAPKR
jgi:hypothetical protein